MNYQDEFCNIYRLSEIKDRFFGYENFKRNFTFAFANFDVYHEDFNGPLRHITLAATDDENEWSKRFDYLIQSYGDIRVCCPKNIYEYKGIGDVQTVKFEVPKSVCHLKLGDLSISSQKDFNWIQRKMLKLFFGIDYEKKI